MTYRDLSEILVLEPMLNEQLIMPFNDLDDPVELTPLAIEKGKAMFRVMSNGIFGNI